jgi:hypothetical protein
MHVVGKELGASSIGVLTAARAYTIPEPALKDPVALGAVEDDARRFDA